MSYFSEVIGKTQFCKQFNYFLNVLKQSKHKGFDFYSDLLRLEEIILSFYVSFH